jgi:hypothetical protein
MAHGAAIGGRYNELIGNRNDARISKALDTGFGFGAAPLVARKLARDPRRRRRTKAGDVCCLIDLFINNRVWLFMQAMA